MECALSWTRNMNEINVKKAKKLLILPFLFGRIRTSNGFSLTFPVCVSFSKKKEKGIGGGNQPVNWYTTWGEFHPFLYPGYSHKSQTDQFEHSDFMTPYASSWMQVLFSGDLLPAPPPPYHCWKWGPHSESSTLWMQWKVHVKHHLPCYRSTKRRAYAPLLAQRFFQCNTMQIMPKELWFTASFPRSVCLPLFPLLSTPLRQFPKYFIYYIQRVTLSV